MLSRLCSLISRAIGLCAFALVLVQVSPAFSQSTFTPMAGAWAGAGTIELRSGTKERVRCKANYIVPGDGQSLKVEVRCASDSYNFELSGSIVQSGRDLSGNWFESTRRIGGKITGQVNGNVIQARAEGDIVTALLTVKTDAGHQSFVMAAPGGPVPQVTIDLRR